MTNQPDPPPSPSTPVSLPAPPPPPALPPAAPSPVAWTPGGPAPAWSPAPAPAKSRVLAAALALLLGGIGIHKFYLGKVAQGIVYILFCWSGIPSLIAWVEGILYLTKSNEAWAAEYGGPVERPSSAAIGCLWLLALLPLLSIIAVIGLIALGGAVASVSGY